MSDDNKNTNEAIAMPAPKEKETEQAEAPTAKTTDQPASQVSTPTKQSAAPTNQTTTPSTDTTVQSGQKPTTTKRTPPPNPKKLLYGCGGCSGLAILFFIGLVLTFVAQTSSNGENPLAQALGVDTLSFTNALIILVNFIFGGVTLLFFVLATIGIFRVAMARKDDKVTKKKGLTMALVSGFIFILTIALWVGIYVFMTSRRLPSTAVRAGIITDPADTISLTAPITVIFDGSNLPIDTRKYDVLSYLWDFGDGNSSTTMITSNTYTQNGRFDVTLQTTKRDTVTNEESIDTFSTVVTIANVQLGAIFTVTPNSGPAPLTVTFDASNSQAPAGRITSYEWDFNDDNVFTDASGVTVEHTFEQIGTYTVNLRITDNTGQFEVASQEIEVSGDNLPTAVIEIPTTDGNYYTGQVYTFQGGKSSSSRGSIEQYQWDFGDNTAKANTRTATHVYQEAGTYEVILKVTDENGTSAEATQQVTIEIPESAPIASITTVPGPTGDETDVIQGPVPFEVSFNASESFDPDGNIVDYTWDFDGDGIEDAAGEQVNYVYKEPGIYNAMLTVQDAENNQSQAIMVVRAESQPLQARVTASPVEGVIPLTVTFDASSSSYPSGQIVSYEWDFGDGSGKRIDVSKVTYKYTKIGTFTVSVTAIASDNTRSTAEIPVNVRPVALTSCFSASPESGEAPLEVVFDPNCSTGTIASYSWDFGDGEKTKTRKPTHLFTTPGSYAVTLEIADNQNVINSFTKNILVTGNL